MAFDQNLIVHDDIPMETEMTVNTPDVINLGVENQDQEYVQNDLETDPKLRPPRVQHQTGPMKFTTVKGNRSANYYVTNDGYTYLQNSDSSKRKFVL